MPDDPQKEDAGSPPVVVTPTDAGMDPVAAPGRIGPLTQPSRSSSISIDEDDHRVVVANVDVGTVSVFSIDYGAQGLPALKKTAEVAVGDEPTSVVTHPNTLSAFVLARKSRKIVRIDDLQTVPKKGLEVTVGSEPTSMALEPSGKTIWVANSVDGTVMGIDTATMAVKTTIDLNATIAASGLLGTYPGRPAMAHPRALAISNSGDEVDVDESIWVTDFYAYQKEAIDATNSNADVAKVAVVYRIPLSTKEPKIVQIPAKSDMGFHDVNDGVAGCFPNQLSGLVIQGGFGYVSSVCASPKGPISLTIKATGPTKTGAATCAADADCHGGAAGSCTAAGKCTTNCTVDADCGYRGKCEANNVCAANPANVRATAASAISVIDLAAEKAFDTVILSKEFDTYYNGLGTPDDAGRRLPLNPLDIGFIPDTVTAYLPASGTDAVFRVDFDATYTTATVHSVGDPKNPFINLAPNILQVGRVPTGIAVAHQARTEGSPRRFAYVANWGTRNVSVIDLENQQLAGLTENQAALVVPSTAMPTGEDLKAQEGKRLFLTGLGRWSYKGQGWLACVSCHADGLSDNVTWQLGSARQAPTLEANYNKKDPSDYHMNLWSAGLDEPSDHEGAIRGFAGGVGGIVKDVALELSSRLDLPAVTPDGGIPPQTGLNGSSMALADPKNPIGLPTGGAVDDWNMIAAYMKTIRSPRAPSNIDAQKITRGEALFKEGKCQGCHGGDTWTISRVFYKPTATPKDATPDNPGLSTMLSRTSWTDAAVNAGFPLALYPAVTPERQTMRANTPILPAPPAPAPTTAPASTLLCGLRPVGTFNVAEPEVGVFEKTTTGADAPGNAPDAKGFNVPSLLGMSYGAPYFHGGQARTLEATFDERFAGHFRALNPAFLSASDPERAEKVSALIQYILSIDNEKATVAVPPLGPEGGVLCKAP